MTASDQDLKSRVARFNEIEDEIERLRGAANSQAGNFLDSYNDSSNTWILVGGVIATAILSALNIVLGICALIFLGFMLYGQNSIASGHKSNMNQTLAKIDELRAEQRRLNL